MTSLIYLNICPYKSLKANKTTKKSFSFAQANLFKHGLVRQSIEKKLAMGFRSDTIYSGEVLKELIGKNKQNFLLLSEAGIPKAFAAYSPREEDPDIFKLHKIYNLPETQGKGYGKALMEAVVEQVKNAGKNKLELNVNRANPAQFFYQKLGFKVMYEEDIPIGPYFMNDYVMRLTW